MSKLTVRDFEFAAVLKEDKSGCDEVKRFIERHEWLGKMPTRPTHRFIARYRGHLAGAVVMATPNTISNLLGADHREKEKLISRGACISWSPKNLGSALIMFAIRWMVRNTEFRYFTAYSDTEARELGTIYQACNFIYLGQSSGARFEWFDPANSDAGHFSDRLFRRASFIKRKAIEAGIEWNPSWNHGEKLLWGQMPSALRHQVEEIIRSFQDTCIKRPVPFKHKYVHILGRSKTETRQLRALFRELNPDKVGFKYPKVRVPEEANSEIAAMENVQARPCRISSPELTERPNPCWPLESGRTGSKKKFYSIKEVSNMYGISSWLIYHHIKTDPTFPVVNVGIKKRFLVEPARFENWLEQKTKKFKLTEHNLVSADELLECK